MFGVRMPYRGCENLYVTKNYQEHSENLKNSMQNYKKENTDKLLMIRKKDRCSS